VKAFDTCELGGSIFYDPQKVVLHKYQSAVTQSLFYTSLKSPQGLRRLDDFLGIKKTFTVVKAFDTCDPELNGLGAIDEDVLDQLILLYEKAQINKTGNDKVVIQKVPDEIAEIIKNETGVSVKNFNRVFEFSEARHIYLSHGQTKQKYSKEKPIESEDFCALPLILNKFDTVTYQKSKTKRGNDSLRYEKRVGKVYIVAEEILYDSKTLRLKTFFIKNASKNFLKGISEALGVNKGLPKVPSTAVRPKRGATSSTKIQKPFQKAKPGTKKSLDGIMSIASASETKFDLLGLDGEYLNMIGEACRPTSFFMYGPGGSGKSTFTLKFAHYLAQKNNKVAYVAGEQYNTPVLKKMLERLKLSDIPNFHIVKNLDVINPGNYDVIVIDSKDSLDITHEDFKKLQEKYPKQTWAILSQATKDGGFTGSEKWRNLVDTMIYCEDGIAATGIDKNRWGGKNEIKVY
jgi:hypothetical protein